MASLGHNELKHYTLQNKNSHYDGLKPKVLCHLLSFIYFLQDEIERLQSEAESLKQENTLLHSQLKDLPSSSGSKSTERSAEDATMLINLNKKIQEAQSAHEKLSKDMKKIKKVFLCLTH